MTQLAMKKMEWRGKDSYKDTARSAVEYFHKRLEKATLRDTLDGVKGLRTEEVKALEAYFRRH